MTVRIALIGAGVMGADHARIFAQDIPNAELRVVCDASPERAERIAQACGVRDVSTDPLTLGYGHDEQWWRQFCYRLLMVGYDRWLSIEHEDVLLNSLEGLEKSVHLLKQVMPLRQSDFQLQAI